MAAVEDARISRVNGRSPWTASVQVRVSGGGDSSSGQGNVCGSGVAAEGWTSKWSEPGGGMGSHR